MKLSLIAMNTPVQIGKLLGDRVRTLRLLEDWTRDTLASRAGVAASSLKRFETTGKASLDLVLRVAHALGRLEEFDAILIPQPARTLADLERQSQGPSRKRGRK
jgi:transcriptional regulator with XRE-family HTH domain